MFPPEHQQRLWRQHPELSGEPAAHQADADQMCRRGEPLPAAGALHRVGREDLGGVLRPGLDLMDHICDAAGWAPGLTDTVNSDLCECRRTRRRGRVCPWSCPCSTGTPAASPSPRSPSSTTSSPTCSTPGTVRHLNASHCSLTLRGKWLDERIINST